MTSAGYNLVGIGEGSGATFSGANHDQAGTVVAPLDAKLGALGNNGGGVPTMALLPGSPALDAGDDGVLSLPNSLATDARGPGFARKRGAHVDIGAFESVPPMPSLSVGNAPIADEGSAASPGSATFTVTLSAPFDRAVFASYATADGTAKAGSDYLAKSSALSFAPGETVKRVALAFIGDDVPEPNETFFLDLKMPINATIVGSRGSATIRNDDGPQIFIDDAKTADEGDGGTKPQIFTVRLSAPSTVVVSVDWATADNTAGPADYVAASGTLAFAPGTTSKIIVVQVKGDTLAEPTETYRVNLTNPRFAVLGDSQGIGTIRDDDGAPPPSAIRAADEPSQ